MAWEMRLSSWCKQIREDAGRLKGGKCTLVPGVFEYVDEAMLILKQCGPEVYARYGRETFDLLTTECCRQLAARTDPRLFRVNPYNRLAFINAENRSA